MQTILIVIHLMIVIALVGVVLLQRSEGGGLGIGGGGGFMSARGAANTLTRTTSILGAAFFATSIALGVLARYSEDPTDVLDRIPSIGETAPGQEGTGSGNGVLDQLGGPQTPAAPAAGGVPSDAGAASPAPAQPAPAPAPSVPQN